jgi:hypothetical protein
MNCSKWFDVDCIGQGAVAGPATEWKTTSKTATAILRMPIERGALPFEAQEWRLTGNGEMAVRVMAWYKETKFPSDWKDQLGLSFLKYARKTIFSYYKCPICECII